MRGGSTVHDYDLEKRCDGVLSFDRAGWTVDPAALATACVAAFGAALRRWGRSAPCAP